MTCVTDRGGPIERVDPKRSFDKVPIQIDWHDYLINERPVGQAVALDFRFRLPRDESFGLQFRCTTPGNSSKRDTGKIAWPRGLSGVGQPIEDGTVIWTAEPLALNSMRSTINSEIWPPVDGLTLSDPSVVDFIYTIYVDGGESGTTYDVKHQIVLDGIGEEKEGVAILEVLD